MAVIDVARIGSHAADRRAGLALGPKAHRRAGGAARDLLAARQVHADGSVQMMTDLDPQVRVAAADLPVSVASAGPDIRIR